MSSDEYALTDPGDPGSADPDHHDSATSAEPALQEQATDEADVVLQPHLYVPSFTELGVQREITDALDRVGITSPFPIQAMTLPVALTGHDIIGQAKTGTGKTLGFGIPLLQRVCGPDQPGWADLAAPGRPQALVVVPTRELAVQVAGDLDTASKLLSLRVLTVYGGRAYEPQVEALRRGVEVVVGTPGRLLDLAQQGHLTLAHARVVVLDEADEMLDLGFLPDVERLLGMTPDGRQMMLFSATMPGAVVALARRYMTQPTHIRASDPDDTGATVKATKQFVYRAHALDKVEMLARMLQAEGRGLTMIFARTKRTVAKVADDLAERGFAAAAIHGDLGQGAREQALRAFRNGKVDVLVATDVAARGIDVDDVTHVINYQCPEDEKTYLHRIGRTGRAGNTGVAITFVDWDEMTRWSQIDRALDLGIPEAAETYSSSEHFFTDLGIPAGTTGMLPRGSRVRAGLGAEVVEDLGETGRARRGAGSGVGSRTESGSRGTGSRGTGSRGSGSRGSGSRGDGGRGETGGREAGARSESGGSALSGGRAERARVERTGSDRPAARDETADGDSSSRPRRTRERRRTRGGETAQPGAATGDGAPAANVLFLPPANYSSPAGSDPDSGPQREAADGPAESAISSATADAAEASRRRRRRRGGRGRSSRPASAETQGAAAAE